MKEQQLTVKDLFEKLKTMIDAGHGDAALWFDSEARTFDYHYVALGSVYFEAKENVGEDMVVLYEVRT